jgi:hypothetical protein
VRSLKIVFESAQNIFSTIPTLAPLQRQKLALRAQTFVFAAFSLREEWLRKNIEFALSEANSRLCKVFHELR